MKPFTDTLAALRFGTLNEELTAKLHELTVACTDTQRAGVLTLKLGLRPGKGGQIEVFDDVTITKPKEDRGSSIMFVTPEHNLVREDPRQMKLGLKAVDMETGELLAVPASPKQELKVLGS